MSASVRQRCLAWLTDVESEREPAVPTSNNDNDPSTSLDRRDNNHEHEHERQRQASPQDSGYQSVNRKRKRERSGCEQDYDPHHQHQAVSMSMERAQEQTQEQTQEQAQARHRSLDMRLDTPLNLELELGHVAVDRRTDNDPTPTKKRPKRDSQDDVAAMRSDCGASTSRASYSDVRSTGSSSPAKQLSRLRSLPSPIVDLVRSDADEADLPAVPLALFMDLDRCRSKQAVVPAHFRSILREQQPMRSVWRGADVWKEGHSAPSQLPTLDELHSLVQEANELNVCNELEAAWNTHCHGPTLVLARRLSPHRQTTRTVNISHAKLHNRFYAGLQTVPRKMVDFGIALHVQDNDQQLNVALATLRTEDDGVRYCNHTSSPFISGNPLAISIETKRAETGGTAAKLQLRIWAGAQMEWFAEMRKAPLPLEPSLCKLYLPLLVAIGSRWEWMFARGEFDPNTGRLHRTAIFPQQAIGDVATLDGLFAVLEAFRVLFEWLNSHWRPWLIYWLIGHRPTGPQPLQAKQT